MDYKKKQREAEAASHRAETELYAVITRLAREAITMHEDTSEDGKTTLHEAAELAVGERMSAAMANPATSDEEADTHAHLVNAVRKRAELMLANRELARNPGYSPKQVEDAADRVMRKKRLIKSHQPEFHAAVYHTLFTRMKDIEAGKTPASIGVSDFVWEYKEEGEE